MKVAAVLPVILASMVVAISPRITLHFSDGTSSIQARSDASCLNVPTVSSVPTSALQINDFGMYCFAYDALNCTGDRAKLGNTDWYNLDDLPGLANITSFWCWASPFC